MVHQTAEYFHHKCLYNPCETMMNSINKHTHTHTQIWPSVPRGCTNEMWYWYILFDRGDLRQMNVALARHSHSGTPWGTWQKVQIFQTGQCDVGAVEQSRLQRALRTVHHLYRLSWLRAYVDASQEIDPPDHFWHCCGFSALIFVFLLSDCW